MRQFERVYAICSKVEDDFMIFNTKNRAQKWIDDFTQNEHLCFEKSKKEDLYIISKIIH